MHTVSKNDENSLRLTGNKIKLASRCRENNSTASSRCALLGRGISRPLSAVPLLNLNYNEFDLPKSTRRALSADFPIGVYKKSYVPKMNDYEPNSLESSEVSDVDINLPSSQLLQNMLSEPLSSWRNGMRCPSTNKHKVYKKTSPKIKLKTSDNNSESNETLSAASDSSSSVIDSLEKNAQLEPTTTSLTKISCETNIKETQQSQLENNKNKESPSSLKQNEIPNTSILIPGLKTKPPLPKKVDTAQSRSPSSYKQQQETNFEQLMLKPHYDLMPPSNISIHNDQYDNLAKDQDEQASTTTTVESVSESIELKLQNWIEEEQIVKSEFKTDLSLHNLKVQNKSSKKNNCEKFNLDELKSDYEKHRRKFASPRNFVQENIKTSSARSKKSPTGEKKIKFTATQIKGGDENCCQMSDVQSWMSSNQKDLNEENDVVRPIVQQQEEKPASYLDFLNTIEELEEAYDELGLQDIPEQDVDVHPGNTYDDIAAILKVLAEADKKSHNNMESMKEIISNELSSSSTLESKEEKNERNNCSDGFGCENEIVRNRNQSENCYSLDSLVPSVVKQTDSARRLSLHSAANLNDIFTYLDEVDKNCTKTISCAKERIHSTAQVMDNSLLLDTMPKYEELLRHTNEELSNYIIDLNLRIKEKSSGIALLQKELSSLRKQITKMTNDSNEIIKQRLKTQKEDYENVVKRHQKFIDQLITDKKTLNQQCESLLHEMKVLEDRYNSNIKAAEHRHKVELLKVKEMQAAGEKIRKERWIDSKTQKIKELTIRGLEPELDKMAARHQQELSEIRNYHKREIEDLELRNARKMQQQCEAIREQMTEEREKALAHERETLRQRYDKMVESEEHNYQEQRRKLLAEHANRILDCEERENLATSERDRAIKQAQIEFEDKLQTVIRRHNSELNVLKEKTELEMEAFRNNYKKQAAMQIGEKEMQIKERFKKERDKEIEAVIERLETESEEIKAQIEQTAENRIKRLKEKYEIEIKDLERLEKETTAKYCETKNKLLEAEDIVINLRSSLKQMESQYNETKKFLDKLTDERHRLKDVVKEETKQEILALQKELRELKIEKDKELQQVYARVKLAVARKDEALSELGRDNASLQEKCLYLENMLEQQRKEYLMK